MQEEERDLVQAQELRFLGFFGEEAEEAEREVRSVVFGAFISHPICVVCRTLAQLGYNPLPLNKGKYFIFAGPACLFHPNFFAYARHIFRTYGFRSLWVGAEVALAREALTCAIRLVVTKQLEVRYFEVGGGAEIARVGPRSVAERFQLFIRFIIRSSICVFALDLFTYPFLLIQTRTVAQMVCGRKIYGDLFDSLSLICEKNGFMGLYVGLTPLLVSSMTGMALTHLTSFSLDVLFYKLINNLVANEGRTWIRSILDGLCSFARKSITYPYALASVITSTAGSSLPVRDITYRSGLSPKCEDWRQVHALLRRSGNQWRGRYSFFRSYTGPFTIGFDGRYYAAPILSI